MNVKYLHQFSSYNRKEILQSKTCGCFCCLRQFNIDKITKWIDEDEDGVGQSALCPFCEVDAILPDKSVDISSELLAKMKEYWF